MIRRLKEMLRVWLRRAALASTFGVLEPLSDVERRRQAKVYPWDKQSDEKLRAAVYLILGALVGVVAGLAGLDILVDVMVRPRNK